MSEIFNIYCDESCHLEHDRQKVMVLGAVWCPLEKTREIAIRLEATKSTIRSNAEHLPTLFIDMDGTVLQLKGSRKGFLTKFS